MTEREYDEVHDLWEGIRKDVCNLMRSRLSAQPLSADQIQFVYEKCTEDLYHAGWNAMENITPGKKITNQEIMETRGTNYDKELQRLRDARD